jgi:hypothetical protein
MPSEPPLAATKIIEAGICGFWNPPLEDLVYYGIVPADIIGIKFSFFSQLQAGTISPA